MIKLKFVWILDLRIFDHYSEEFVAIAYEP
jgi:hypothetical protein